ncbi:zinc finger CCCH-type with G patch domain-containing protein [Gastrophryne carolinensis]
MDEASLAGALQTYRAQLEQVRVTLRGSADQSQRADLLQLEGDLQQLIELTESSLLSVQKCNLLSSLEAPPSSSLEAPPSCQQDDEYEAFMKAVGELSNDSECNETAGAEENQHNQSEDEEEVEDESSGMKVRAPYYSTWGTLEYHNAMIVCSEQTEDGGPGVRILYLYPTHKAMKPCPYFLDGNCRFHDKCRFSHGQVVPMGELRAFEEPDLASMGPGKTCLARHSDGIWYPGQITDVEDSFYTVKFDSLLLKEAVLEADAIMPPLRGSEDSSSSSEEEEEGAEDSGYARVMVESGGGGPGVPSSEFAGWEAHTRGIGSKLMALMGYEFGKGLGRNSEGRIEPVQAVVLPKGKSLDQCLEMQQRKLKGGQKPHKARRKRGAKSAGAGQGSSAPRRNVFDFLNEKLEAKGHNERSEGTRAAPERKGKEVYNASQSSKRALSIALAQTTGRIQQKQREIGRMAEAVARNVGSGMCAQLEKRLAGARSELAGLQQEERSLQKEQRKADTHKKMTEF